MKIMEETGASSDTIVEATASCWLTLSRKQSTDKPFRELFLSFILLECIYWWSHDDVWWKLWKRTKKTKKQTKAFKTCPLRILDDDKMTSLTPNKEKLKRNTSSGVSRVPVKLGTALEFHVHVFMSLSFVCMGFDLVIPSYFLGDSSYTSKERFILCYLVQSVLPCSLDWRIGKLSSQFFQLSTWTAWTVSSKD